MIATLSDIIRQPITMCGFAGTSRIDPQLPSTLPHLGRVGCLQKYKIQVHRIAAMSNIRVIFVGDWNTMKTMVYGQGA